MGSVFRFNNYRLALVAILVVISFAFSPNQLLAHGFPIGGESSSANVLASDPAAQGKAAVQHSPKNRLVIKFKEGSNVRLRNGKLTSTTAIDLAGVLSVLD